VNPIGAHMSIAGGLHRVFERLEAVGGECLQLFVKPNVQLRDIIGLSRSKDRLGVCLDTSHVYAAGYDLSGAEAYEDFFCSFDRLISLKRLKAVHANDSKTSLGAKADRHEQIGLGRLGIQTFERLLRDPRLSGRPFILETPKGKQGDIPWDEINIQTLKRLREGPQPAGDQPVAPTSYQTPRRGVRKIRDGVKDTRQPRTV
jgi:endonuclease IV